jgi:hypothetical protein
VETFCVGLPSHGDGEDSRKDRRSIQVAEIHRHGHGVTAGLAERRREYLDDPECQGDFGNFTGAVDEHRLFGMLIHAASLPSCDNGGPC